ncbi:MAG: superoxide dismutase, partial [Flavobacteriales bacterium]|nr:superoxide dismutase [Flavobacteriales bacterium]
DPPTRFLQDEEDFFFLPELPYAHKALEPHIDTLTMEIHHGKHHQGYVNKLNKALKPIDASLLEGYKTFSSIFKHIQKLPTAVRNNAGGHYNHTLFWTFMKPDGGGEPKGPLADAINSTFGSFAEFKIQFAAAAKKRFGSGWVWLVVNDQKLVITSTPNQDNPLMQLDSIKVKGTPILALDVWEHAYYLKNQNRRGDYVKAWWNVVNWTTSADMYNSAISTSGK